MLQPHDRLNTCEITCGRIQVSLGGDGGPPCAEKGGAALPTAPLRGRPVVCKDELRGRRSHRTGVGVAPSERTEEEQASPPCPAPAFVRGLRNMPLFTEIRVPLFYFHSGSTLQNGTEKNPRAERPTRAEAQAQAQAKRKLPAHRAEGQTWVMNCSALSGSRPGLI